VTKKIGEKVSPSLDRKGECVRRTGGGKSRGIESGLAIRADVQTGSREREGRENGCRVRGGRKELKKPAALVRGIKKGGGGK